MRNQNWVIKIDYRDGHGQGDILWRLGPDGDFTLQGVEPIDWNYAQHHPVLISSRSAGLFPLALFDNGNSRIVDSKGTACGSPGAIPCYSRGVIFQLEEMAKTAQILWQDKLSNFGLCCGSINQLDNQNIEFDIALLSAISQASRVQEVTQEQDPRLVWQMDILGQLAYRAFRMPSLYPGVQW